MMKTYGDPELIALVSATRWILLALVFMMATTVAQFIAVYSLFTNGNFWFWLLVSLCLFGISSYCRWCANSFRKEADEIRSQQ